MYTCTMAKRKCSAEPLMRSILSQRIFTSLPGSRLRFFIAMQIQYSYYSTPLYSSINRLYAQNPVFEIVREESVKVYPHIHKQRECPAESYMRVESCVTKEFSIFPRFSPTTFDPDANLVLLRAHLCTAVDYGQKTPVFEIFQESVKVYTTEISY